MKAQIYFVVSVAKVFTKFTGIFQSKSPLIHVLHDSLNNLLMVLFGFLKTSVIANVKNAVDMQGILGNVDNFLPPNQFEFGEGVREELLQVSERDSKEFLIHARQHYVSACKHLIEKTSLFSNSEILKCLRFLQPEERLKTRSCKDILKVARTLPFPVPTDSLLDEWKVLQLEKSVNMLEGEQIDHYWQKYVVLPNEVGDLKYPNVSRVVKACLSLSHGSADIERGFSRSGRILTDDRASMSLRTLNAKLTTSEALRQYNNRAELVPITRELLNLSQVAHKSYTNHLEQIQTLKEQAEKEREVKERCSRLEEERQKELKEGQTNITKMKTDLEKSRLEQNKKRAVSDKLLLEANDRLKKALKNNDISEAQLAQAMLEGVQLTRKEEREHSLKIDKSQKTLEKQKDSLILNCAIPKKKSK